ncbi:hypothetical protein CEXT_533971 [Caerostris extrusa]|uniref:Uncharacterized protein n=1 Tax=Caerostris extrusa TaxID=172846 RepID=A0AAV4P1F5_CAEEX|nr:hypothetical protein CEXT_533971 [Caerostris extrusa]
MVTVLSPILESIGYGFSWNYGAVLVWGGLRGAVGLALVLISQHDIPSKIANQVWDLVKRKYEVHDSSCEFAERRRKYDGEGDKDGQVHERGWIGCG